MTKVFSFSVAVFSLLSIVLSCNNKPATVQNVSIPGYNLAKPVKIELKTSLDEISGLHFYPKDTSVFANNDEEGLLFKIYLRNKVVIKKWKFSNEGDYEDLSLVDSTFYALHSNGNLSVFRFKNDDSITDEEYELPISGKNEFETLYFDSTKGKLVLICKDCKHEKREVSAFAFDPETKTFGKEALFKIDGQSILEQLKGTEKKFKPSAAAIHPVTGELFIVSSVNKALVVASGNGEVKHVYPLDERMFKQPEGITFTPDGTMLISNESADAGAGNILIFKYKR